MGQQRALLAGVEEDEGREEARSHLGPIINVTR